METVTWPTFTGGGPAPLRPTRAATMATDEQNPGGAIALTITGKDIWDKLVKIEREVSGTPAIVADHEVRIRTLERKVWLAAGFAAAIGGVGGGALSKIIGA